MKRFVSAVVLALAGLIFACSARAQVVNPPCKPSSAAAIRYSTTLDGAWAYWWCTSNTYMSRMILWRDVTKPLRERAKAYMLGNDPSFIDLVPSEDGTAPKYDSLWLDMRLAIGADTDRPPATPPAPVWRVAPNGVLPDRAVFAFTGGKRSFASMGRINVGLPASAPVLTESTTTYCLVAPAVVTQCSRQPTP